jgi:putative DNA-invertase from lambdoid prophage Rac
MVAAAARAALYNTLSPIDSDPERAFRELRAFAAARGFRVASEFVDRGFPDPHRPQRAHLLETVLEGTLDLVAVWRLERFGRSLHDIVASIDHIVRAGVGFISVHEQLDFSTPVARQVMIALVHAQDHFFAERAHAGFLAAKARGVKLGRPRKPIDPAAVQADYDRGFSLRECARLHGISHSTVIRVLHDQREK